MTSEESILQALAQADDDQATRIFQDYLRRVVRVGLMKTMAAEVERLCGPKYRPDKAGGFCRAGSEPGQVFVNGGKEKVTRPRVRTHDGREVKLESYRAASDQRGLFESVGEAVAAGLPVRGVECCHGGSVKRWKTNGGSRMVSRWMAARLLRAERGFRRVYGHDKLGLLAAALGRGPAAIPASAPEEVAAAPSSCAPAGMAAE